MLLVGDAPTTTLPSVPALAAPVIAAIAAAVQTMFVLISSLS
jgi:hypothetical protein